MRIIKLFSIALLLISCAAGGDSPEQEVVQLIQNGDYRLSAFVIDNGDSVAPVIQDNLIPKSCN